MLEFLSPKKCSPLDPKLLVSLGLHPGMNQLHYFQSSCHCFKPHRQHI